MAKDKDLFDESTMSFGEHLEVLRVHLWKAIIGLVLCVILTLIFGNHVIAFVRSPIDRALREYNFPGAETDDLIGFDFSDYIKGLFSDEEEEPKSETAKKTEENAEKDPRTIRVKISKAELYSLLHEFNPDLVAKRKKPDEKETVELSITAEEFKELEKLVDKSSKTVALNVQEAFLTYLKVSLISGFVLASPWIFYQIWLFVAAGLYPHERRYIHVFLPMSIFLFIGGALFCFFAVFPYVLDFLLGFNKSMGVDPQIRLSEWISFALILPLMFGISFQLPMVMLFLQRVQIVSTETYRTKRRMAVLVIAFLSMLLTPADPMSMMMMMVPLLILYEFGILLCGFRPATTPFQDAEAKS